MLTWSMVATNADAGGPLVPEKLPPTRWAVKQRPTQAPTASSLWSSSSRTSATSRGELAAAEADARAIMRESHELTEGEADDFTIRDQTDLAETATATTEVMTLLLAGPTSSRSSSWRARS